MKNRFYEFKNIAENEYSLYVYGEIVSEKIPDYYTGEKSENEVDITDFKQALADIPNGAKLNMYVNSVGGSVFATSAIVSMLQRAKARGVAIDAYIDGLSASCASWLVMVADNINIYKNSVMMIHKPMSFAIGNANDMQKEIDTLDTIENNMMVPMYLSKAKVSEEEIKNLINDETWFSANEKDKNFIGNYFNVNLLDEAKEVTACVSKGLFRNYKNVPTELVQVPKQQEDVVETQNIDYSYFENKLKTIKK